MAASILWHYTNAAGAIGILENGVLRASDIRFLNDSKEYDLAVHLLREVTRERLESSSRELEQELSDRIELALAGNRPYTTESHSNAGYFAACLSEREDDLSQWRGYADGGGFALGFDAELLTSLAADNGFRLSRCIYEPSQQKALLHQAFDEAWAGMQPELEDHRHVAVNRAVAGFFMDFDNLAPRIKHEAFTAESEWRLVRGPIDYDGSPSDRIRIRSSRSHLIPFIDFPLSSAGTPKPIRRAVVGPTPHPDLARKALRHLVLASGLAAPDFEVGVSTSPYRAW